MENLYRPGGEYGPSDDETYAAKLKGLADTVNGLLPDLLGVQEVGEPEALGDLVDLEELYANLGNADPLVVACALNGQQGEEGALFSLTWTVVSGDKAVQATARAMPPGKITSA